MGTKSMIGEMPGGASRLGMTLPGEMPGGASRLGMTLPGEMPGGASRLGMTLPGEVLGGASRLGMTLLLLCACGTRVDAGRNGAPPAVAGNPGTPGATGAPGPAVTPVDGGQGLTCLGVSPALVAPADAICAGAAAADKATFAKAFAALCDAKTVDNLLRDGCAWDGSGSQLGYFTILDQTPLAAVESAEFLYDSAYAVLVPKDLGATLGTTMLAYTDPTTFVQRYKMPPNTRIYDPSQITGGVEYSVESSTSVSVTGFRGRLRRVDLAPGLTVLYDESIGSLKGLKVHRQLTIFATAPGGKTRVVTYNEKDVVDGGVHQASLSTLENLDLDRMGAFNANSSIP
jgi:hypothetical protein